MLSTHRTVGSGNKIAFREVQHRETMYVVEFITP